MYLQLLADVQGPCNKGRVLAVQRHHALQHGFLIQGPELAQDSKRVRPTAIQEPRQDLRQGLVAEAPRRSLITDKHARTHTRAYMSSG